ncbi:MAG: aldose epimerase [Bacteroidetes bacterium]|nr:MAG: aldose epimerase [Bacteroidota bacterium]
MTHTISNELFRLGIQQQGVEISSLKSLKTDTEYIWDAKPEIWGSHAPVLFPIIGALNNGATQIENALYAIPKHGLIRHNNNLELIAKTENSLEFQLLYSEETLALYPFKFAFTIKYQLEGSRLIVSHLVENRDEKTMPFALGGHPAFKCPFNAQEDYSDYYLEFTEAETASRWMLDDKGLLNGIRRPYLAATKELALHSDMFHEDALVFTDLKSRTVTLRSRKSQNSLKVSFADFPYLGLWAKPNANFICIEPWQGLTDPNDRLSVFSEKMGLIHLPASESYRAEYSIEITEAG